MSIKLALGRIRTKELIYKIIIIIMMIDAMTMVKEKKKMMMMMMMMLTTLEMLTTMIAIKATMMVTLITLTGKSAQGEKKLRISSSCSSNFNRSSSSSRSTIKKD